MSEAARPSGRGAFLSEIVFAVCAALAVGGTLLAIDFPQSAPGAGLAALTVVIARADWRERIIPNWASLTAAGLALAEAQMSEEPRTAILDAFSRGAVVFLLFLGFRFAFRIWRGREGMGLGDVKLAGVLGLWLEWAYLSVAIELACLSALAYVLASRFASGRAVDGLAKLPFGAFLAPAIWLTWMWEKIAL